MKKKKHGEIVVKRLASGKLSVRVSAIVFPLLERALRPYVTTTYSLRKHQPITVLSSWTLQEFSKRIDWTNYGTPRKFLVTRTQAAALIYALSIYNVPYIIELKAALLRAII